jgi:hypothetical protein
LGEGVQARARPPPCLRKNAPQCGIGFEVWQRAGSHFKASSRWACSRRNRFAGYGRRVELATRIGGELFSQQGRVSGGSELSIAKIAVKVGDCARFCANEPCGNKQNSCAIFVETSQSLGRVAPGSRGGLSSSEPNHNRFSFQHITQRFLEQHFFHILVLSAFATGRLAAILIFRGSSTSSPNLVQECSLSTTCVTVSTSGTFNQRQHKQGKHSWRRYLTAAPMLWLARAWC